MKKIFLISFLIFSNIIFAKRFNPTESKLNNEFQKNLTLALSNYLIDNKFNVFVKVKILKNSKSRTSSNMGYLQSPMLTNIEKSIEINNINVVVQLEKELKDENSLKKVIAASIGNFPTVINIDYISSELKNSNRLPASNSEMNAPDNKILKPSFIEKNLTTILGFLSVLFIGTIILISLIYFSKSLKSSFGAIGDSLLNMNNKSTNLNNKVTPTQNTDSQSSVSEKEVLNSITEKHKEGLIQTIIEVINKTPESFTAAINQDDYRGIKMLLPYLISKVGEKMNSCFSADFIRKIESSDNLSYTNTEFVNWLGLFSEKITLTHLKNQSGIMVTIDPGIRDQLFKLSFEDMITGAFKLDHPECFQLLFSLLPVIESEKLVQKFTFNQWKKLFATKKIFGADVDRIATNLITSANKDTTNNNDQIELFLTPIENFLRNSAVGKDDEFLDEMKKVSPELAEKIEENYWSVKKLYEVPENFLKTKLLQLNPESKFFLVSGIDQDLQDYLLDMIPDGKAKTILRDQVNKKLNRDDPSENIICNNFVKQFVDSLKKDHKSNRFNFNDSSEEISLAA